MVVDIDHQRCIFEPLHPWQGPTRHSDQHSTNCRANLIYASGSRGFQCIPATSNGSRPLPKPRPAPEPGLSSPTAGPSDIESLSPVISQHSDLDRSSAATKATADSRPESSLFTFPKAVIHQAFSSLETSFSNIVLSPPKRRRARSDVDGPGTDILSCKKRRLRYHLITSRLSQPFSLPATHILNREGPEDTPVLSRFLKMAAAGAKKAGHQTTLVRKAAILNRIRLRVREDAVSRGHAVMAAAVASPAVFDRSIHAVTSPTGSMFPGTGSGSWIRDMPSAWKPHTTQPGSVSSTITAPAGQNAPVSRTPPPDPRPSTIKSPSLLPALPPEAVDDDEETSFPGSQLDGRYDSSDDDMDDVYADFGALFGPGSVAADATTPRSQGDDAQSHESDHFYEEYLDELDGLPWSAV